MTAELLPNGIVKLMIYLIWAGMVCGIVGPGLSLILELPEHIFYTSFGMTLGLFLSAAMTFALEPNLTKEEEHD